jgi:putative transposase
VKYASIRSHQAEFSVRLMCRLLDVSVSGFYAYLKRGLSKRAQLDSSLIVEIEKAHRQSRKTYGSPRIHRELRATGLMVSEKRVARLMRECGIRAKTSRRFKVTTNSDHANPVAPNLLGRQFSPSTIGGTNRVWASDITYISTREGWLYLSVVIDLGSRRVVGWAMQETLERSLVIDALRMALRQRQPTQGMIHHSDRGIQYASTDYGELLKTNQIECSMSRLGDCWDNAVAESFFATLKKELVADSKWKTRAEAKSALFEFIEVWYNRQRRHSAIEYLSPAEYEKQLLRQVA